MKKLFAIVLTLALVLALGTTAFAAGEITSTTANENTATNAVTATVGSQSGIGTVISVDVIWGASSITYTPAYNSAWNTESHTYTQTAAAWTGSADVTVANHSNTAVTATVTFAGATGITGSVANNTDTLDAGTNVNDQPVTDSMTATLTITGGEIAEAGTIGNLTVTITAAN